MKNTCPFNIVFQVLKLLFIKICNIQPLDLLYLVVFIIFYISGYNSLQIFRTSFNIIWRKDFRHNLFSFNGYTQDPPSPPKKNHYLLVLGFNKNLETPFSDSIFIFYQALFYSLEHKNRISNSNSNSNNLFFWKSWIVKITMANII